MEAKQAAPDRLSSLPAELQDEILIRLDLRDAVRTSALSRTWRDLWKSLSVISLSFPFGTHPSVVDSVLLRYIGPRVSLFRICVDDACADRIDDWLIALSRYRVESIDMCGTLRSLGNFNLYSSIFSLGDLVSLLLKNCRIPPLPVGFPGFPALQKLVLAYVIFPSNGFKQLEAIIRRSPLLHTLHMFDVFIPGEYPDSVIEAPNLRVLSIYSPYDYRWRFGELSCLEYANIHVFHCPQHEHDFGVFLARFAHVQKFGLFSPAVDVKMPYTLPFTFYNLKKLQLCVDFNEIHSILSMFTMLRSCHNLQNLKIEVRSNSGRCGGNIGSLE
uniref:F-box domain-containing protein n=2 Tax=Zea mays TaxID=4577 RepID=A0A804Q5K4_MAIZE